MVRDEDDEAIYAVALLTRSELTFLGPALARRTPLLCVFFSAIDDADRAIWRRQDEISR
jgi:hypothetical protein